MARARQDYISSERLDDPSDWFSKAKYRIDYKCNHCGLEYSTIASSPRVKDAPCPNQACQDAACAAEKEKIERNRRGIIESRQAPGITGTNKMVNIVDHTAQVTMDMYGLTDLKDNLRMGDSMVPPLPGKMQQAADNLFSDQGHVGINSTITSEQVEKTKSAAISGAYAGLSVSPKQFLGKAMGTKGLSFVRNEPTGSKSQN